MLILLFILKMKFLHSIKIENFSCPCVNLNKLCFLKIGPDKSDQAIRPELLNAFTMLLLRAVIKIKNPYLKE